MTSAESRRERPAVLRAEQRARVLVVTPDFPPSSGGIQRLIHGVVRHWRNIDARVLTVDAPGAREFDRNEPIEIRRVGSRGILGHRGTIAWLNTAAVVEARRFRPNVVLSGHIVTSPAAWVIRKTMGVPFIQYLYFREINARPRLTRFAVRRANGVVAVSRHTAALALACGAAPERLHRIPPGVNVPESVSSTSKSARPLILTISRLRDRYKGHDVLLQAMPLIRARVPNVLWVVVGDGRLRSAYERTVQEQGLGAHVQFRGVVTDHERDFWLDCAHVFAMPSRQTNDGQGEGFPLVYLEAAARGLPVIAGDVEGAQEAVIDGETGLLINPNDPAALAAAIGDLLLDPGRASRLGRAGSAHARNYSWAGIARQLDELLIQQARY
jgi:phosphatidyl-myo-inositol dimannoside synthase